MFSSFAPGISGAVWGYLEQFSQKATGLRIAGLAVLLFTALSMMSTIETSFNHIWHVRTNRRFRTRFPVYWAVLTLGPILMGAGFAATTYIISLPFVTEFDANIGIKQKLFVLLPFLFESLAFTLMYMLIPNRPVRITHALMGGLFAGCLFELAKRGFTYYVTNFPSQEAIYGAFASIPILLLWIYLSWVVVLLGAVVVRSLSIFRYQTENSHARHQQLRCMVRLVGHLWQARQASKSVDLEALQQREPDVPPELMEQMVVRLDKAGWVEYTESGRLVLLGDLSLRTLGDLIALVPKWYESEGLNEDLKHDRDAWDQNLMSTVSNYRESVQSCMTLPLRSIFEPEDTSPQSEDRN
jgi:membrane protein